MMKRHTIIVGISLFVLSIAAISNAAKTAQAHLPEKHSTRLGTHVHGLSELTIAMEGKSLEIQLTSPAMNLVGFEHKASDPKDIAAVENATSLLREHDSQFLLSGGRCVHVKTSIDTSGLIEGDVHDHTHQTQSNEHNQKHNDHPQYDSHREIVANYQYSCGNTASLPSMTVALFQSFPGIHKIHVMWVKQTQQGAATLTPKNRIIKFR
jgi:Protein of unknown function (DUF2796)